MLNIRSQIHCGKIKNSTISQVTSFKLEDLFLDLAFLKGNVI